MYQGGVEEGIAAALKGRKEGDTTSSGSLTIDYLSGIKKIFLLGKFFTIFTALEDVTQTSLLHLSSAVELI